MREPMRWKRRRTAVAVLLAGGLGAFAGKAAGQSAPAVGGTAAPASGAAAASQKFQGCVQPSSADKSVLVLSAAAVCAKLTGKFSAGEIAGHEIDVTGVLTPRSSAGPASIRVDAVVSVGKACTEVCSLRPPGSRGLSKGGEIPGREGGTPGEAPAPAEAAPPNP